RAHARALLTAVLWGAVPASGALPISVDAFCAAIRAEGKAVDANLRGFERGRALTAADLAPKHPSQADTAPRPMPVSLAPGHLEAFAPEACTVIAEGFARLTDYQEATFAQRSLARLDLFARRAAAAGGFLLER